MKGQAQIVIIGGGIFGISIAYHLAKLGRKDIILLEKDEIASGATAHAAGLVTQFATSQTMMKFRKYSIELYSGLGLFDHVGSLRVASSEVQYKELQRSVSKARAIGMDVEIISPAEAVDIMPQISAENLFGAVYLPQDGHLDPYITTTTMARHVKEMGVSIYTEVRATGIKISPDGSVTHVLTDQGTIKTELIINAAGLWGPRVAAMAGINIPTTPYDHQHIALKAVPSKEFSHNTPCLRDPDNLVYMREEAGGLVIGGYESNPRARWIDGVPWEHGSKSLPPDYDQFDPLMEGAIRRIPFLEQAEVVSLICHPGAYTPDCHPILGPMPGARGLWMAAGMSLNGFGGAGGMGKLLAEWIVEGEPSLDVYGYRATRFGKYFSSPSFAAERTRESVRYYYRLRFPNDENELARPHRLSAVHSRLQDQGAVFGQKYGWERVNYYQPGKLWRQAGADQREWGWTRPPYFELVGKEHQAAREKVALFDLSSFGKIEVEGTGALSLLQRVADSDLDKSDGSVMYTQFLNKNGGVISDITITRLSRNHFRVITGSSFISNDLAWLQMHVEEGDEPVEIKDITTDYACLALWGPKAREVLAKVTENNVSDQAFPYLSALEITGRGTNVLAQRVSYIGELGWELYVSIDRAIQVWDALMSAGEEFGIVPGGYKALDSLRMEKGYRYFTADVTPLENPYEAGLGFCVDMEKANFVGRGALKKSKEKGLDRKLRTLILKGEQYLPIYGGEAISIDGKVISRVRSGSYGYTIMRNIVFAYLPLELSKIGTRFEIEMFDERIEAEVAKTVLYDSKGEQLRK